MAASIKRDDVKQQWESSGDTEFPLVCETCLGDNPYIRMTKESHGKKCKICENPFTVFAWQAGTKGRLKRVEICRTCAQTKNVCQVCIYDLRYGLPVGVRDRVLRETGQSVSTEMPQSNANRAWYSAQQNRAIAQGQDAAALQVNDAAHAKLSEMANMAPHYERNLAKLCSFFAKGECDRGANCPFRHELPKDRNDPLNQQNTKDRFYGHNDPVAQKILGRKRKQEQDIIERADGYEKARATVYVRMQGEPPYDGLNEAALRDAFYAYGELVSVRCQTDRGQAFLEYTQPEAAELAIAKMTKSQISGREIFCAWARAPKRGDGGTATPGPRRGERTVASDTATAAASAASSHGSSAVRPVAPPGSSPSTKKPKKQLPRFNVKPNLGPSIPSTTTTAGNDSNSKPYYPSADPSRLGSSTKE